MESRIIVVGPPEDLTRFAGATFTQGELTLHHYLRPLINDATRATVEHKPEDGRHCDRVMVVIETPKQPAILVSSVELLMRSFPMLYMILTVFDKDDHIIESFNSTRVVPVTELEDDDDEGITTWRVELCALFKDQTWKLVEVEVSDEEVGSEYKEDGNDVPEDAEFEIAGGDKANETIYKDVEPKPFGYHMLGYLKKGDPEPIRYNDGGDGDGEDGDADDIVQEEERYDGKDISYDPEISGYRDAHGKDHLVYTERGVKMDRIYYYEGLTRYWEDERPHTKEN